MFRRVLVANRGEIAARILRTLRKLNIESVIVLSEADKDIPYRNLATQSIIIGPAQARDSYLCQEAILQAALQTNCEAIHPGFGFLSENYLFAQRCLDQKLSFIGPKPEHIKLMGDKAQARNTFKKLGLSVIGGSEDIINNLDHAHEIAQEIKYPILLKARSGGGGKGMRLVKSYSELKDSFLGAQQEAQSSFGDSSLYIEKFIKPARHIEFQVLGDNFNNIVCLGERECSVQRKNQKLLEESPANNFPKLLREKTQAEITRVLQKISYVNAGTVEFLLDNNNKLFFMEMNTRIQVEHPVTELLTGLDLVEWQIRIAANQKLSFSSKNIKFSGVALECRINAEDPEQDFKPNPGKITKLEIPENNINGPLRIDTHIRQDYVIPAFYDSMLAKIIFYASTREQALIGMRKALQNTKISGIKTTIGFQQKILAHENFISGNYDCSLVENIS